MAGIGLIPAVRGCGIGRGLYLQIAMVLGRLGDQEEGIRSRLTHTGPRLTRAEWWY